MVTYMRRQNSLWPVEKKQEILGNRDKMPNVLVLEFKLSIDKDPIYILNTYNLPMKKKQTSNWSETVMGAIGLLRKQAFIMKDVNLYHTDEDNCTVNHTTQAKRFAE